MIIKEQGGIYYTMINIKYCKKCKKAFDIATDKDLCPTCRQEKIIKCERCGVKFIDVNYIKELPLALRLNCNKCIDILWKKYKEKGGIK